MLRSRTRKRLIRRVNRKPGRQCSAPDARWLGMLRPSARPKEFLVAKQAQSGRTCSALEQPLDKCEQWRSGFVAGNAPTYAMRENI